MRDCAQFDFRAGSVGAARRFVAGCLHDVSTDLVQRVELMTSELATNAIKHAGTGFTVAVQKSARTIRVEVSDSGDGSPRRRRVRPHHVSGRGLNIVATLSDRWGVREHAAGSVVWFDVSK